MLLSALVLAVAMADAVPGGPFSMQPQVVTITLAEPAGQFTLSSLYARSSIFDVRVMQWKQTGGKDVLTPDDDFIVSPAVFSIDPYQTVVVRLAPRAPASAVEQSFKIVATRVTPGQVAPPPNAPRLETVLFVPPAAPTIDPSFTLKVTSPETADLSVANHGNVHVYLGNVAIENAQHRVIDETIGGYVLADSTKTFHLRLSQPITGANAVLTYDDAHGQQKVDVSVTR
jgi:fimbrial chaperone protein